MGSDAKATPFQQAMHDLVASLAPEGVTHHCDYCDADPEGQMTATTTMDEAALADMVATKVQEAVADRDAKIAELTQKLGDKEATDAVQAAVDAAVEPLNARVAELEDKLEKETLARGEAESQRDGLQSAIDQASEQAAQDSVRDERVEAVKATNAFPADAFAEDGIVTSTLADQWAGTDAEAWPAKLAEYQTIGAGRAPAGNGPLPGTRSVISDAEDKTPPSGKAGAASKLLASMYPSSKTAAN